MKKTYEVLQPIMHGLEGDHGKVYNPAGPDAEAPTTIELEESEAAAMPWAVRELKVKKLAADNKKPTP